MLYQVFSKALSQAVKRNHERVLEDFTMQPMARMESLVLLFKNYYQFNDFYKEQKPEEGARLICPHAVECQFNKDEEASLTPLIVSKKGKSAILVIMEAPSTDSRPGVTISGDAKWDNEYGKLFELIKERFPDTIIIATEMVKCGVANQSNKQKIVDRMERCFRALLEKEIEILNPKYVLCLGKNVYDQMKNRLNTGSNIKIVKLRHPSGNALGGRKSIKIKDRRDEWIHELDKLAQEG